MRNHFLWGCTALCLFTGCAYTEDAVLENALIVAEDNSFCKETTVCKHQFNESPITGNTNHSVTTCSKTHLSTKRI